MLFRPKTTANNTEVARTHYDILKTINEVYSDTTTIYDNFGSTMKEFSTPQSYDEYLRHFKLQYAKGNPNLNRKPIYLVFHRIQSSIPIGELRKHDTIATLLQKVNVKMTTHKWKEDETRISDLGFFVSVDPGNKLKEDFEEEIKRDISHTMGKNKKKIPRFQCIYSSPFLITAEGNRVATKSYDLECRQQDAKELVAILQTTYKNNPKFIFHRMRHQDKKTYGNAIRKQNLYLSKSRVVPIRGVSEDVMFALDNELLQITGVLSVNRHKDTVSQGRWSIMTTEAQFKQVVSTIKTGLSPWMTT